MSCRRLATARQEAVRWAATVGWEGPSGSGCHPIVTNDMELR